MKYKYLVELQELIEVHEISGAWTNQKFIELLKHIDFDDVEAIPDDELKDMTLMALSDLDPEEAAIKVLEFRFGDRLNKGQRQNIAEELKEDRLWEEYADLKYHEELFNVACMLFWSFPKVYSEPDIVRIQLKIQALNPVSELNVKNLNASFIARILNDGMEDNNMIYRLFDEQINSNKFTESEDIIWQFEESAYSDSDHSKVLILYTSWNWVEKLKGVKNYESLAFSDGQLI